MKSLVLIVLFIHQVFFLSGQNGLSFKEGSVKESIEIKLHSNLIIVPAKVNGVELYFILDTGATKDIIFSLVGIDSLQMKAGRYISINGYGSEVPINALLTSGNKVELGNFIIDEEAQFLVVESTEINFAPKLDIDVHGILGAKFLKNLITHFDYENEFLRIYKDSESFPSYLRDAQSFDLSFKNFRPFFNGELDFKNKVRKLELLIDTGSGDALWVFDEFDSAFELDNSFEDYLGYGMNGAVIGLRTKAKSLQLLNNTLKKVALSFPYKEYTGSSNDQRQHNSSLGGEILRRFDMVINYPEKKIIMLPNENFNERFFYNMSGIGVKNGVKELMYVQEMRAALRDNYRAVDNATSSNYIRTNKSYNSYNYRAKIIVDYVREGSPAALSGVQVGDQIIAINRISEQELTIDKVSELFFKNPHKKLKIRIKRGDNIFKVEIVNIPLVL
jgi:hypothetical protein